MHWYDLDSRDDVILNQGNPIIFKINNLVKTNIENMLPL